MSTVVSTIVRDVSPVFRDDPWKRMAGFVFGIATQGLFALTVVGLYSFLRHGAGSPGRNWLVTDTILALQFAVPHSVLLHPRFRGLFRRWFPGEMHGVFFCACTCLSLQVMFRFWQTSGQVWWDLNGASASLIRCLFSASWGSLIYSIALTGAGFQTGWTQWLCWYRPKVLPRRNFEARIRREDKLSRRQDLERRRNSGAGDGRLLKNPLVGRIGQPHLPFRSQGSARPRSQSEKHRTRHPVRQVPSARSPVGTGILPVHSSISLV